MEQKKDIIPKSENNGSFDKGTILIVVILFMFSSKLLDIVWDIGKALIYIIVIIYCLNYLNPNIADKIKEIINDFINFDSNGVYKKNGESNNIFKNLISKISSTVLNIFKPVKSTKKEIIEEPVDQKVVRRDIDLEKIRKTDIPFDAGVRTLDNRENTIGRKLSN